MTPVPTRCDWSKANDLMIAYHDSEWGVPVHDDRKLFEFLVLDAFQAGLSWSIVLNKRDGFRRAFVDFEPAKIARFNSRSVERLVKDERIIRNRQKIVATIGNAKRFLDIQDEFATFDAYIWQFVGGKTRVNRWRTMKQIPSTTKQSDAMSADLKSRGLKFVGSTICYAFMQGAGMVNDHVVGCFRYGAVV